MTEGNPTGWRVKIRPDEYLDFAVRALVHDGLKVSPFDLHGPGTGGFQGVGLDGRSWVAWVQSIASAYEASLAALERGDGDEHIVALLKASNPLNAIQRVPVSPYLVEALQRFDGGRRRILPSLAMADAGALSPDEVCRLLDRMHVDAASGSSERMLVISLVNYESLVAMRLGPATVLVGCGPGQLEWNSLRAALFLASDPPTAFD